MSSDEKEMMLAFSRFWSISGLLLATSSKYGIDDVASKLRLFDQVFAGGVRLPSESTNLMVTAACVTPGLNPGVPGLFSAD